MCVYFPNLLVSSKKADCGCLPASLCVFSCVGMRSHMREGVRMHDMHFGPKSYELNVKKGVRVHDNLTNLT